MMLETFDLGLDARGLQVLFGAGLGVIFGIAAQVSRLCLRRAVAGPARERGPAAGVWLTAFAVSLLALQGLVASGHATLDGHRWLTTDLPVVALVAGGLAFGVGMVLTRGCLSRLTVLGATGNLRALTVILVFAIIAHAMMKGVLAPVRTALGAITVESPVATLAALPGGAGFWSVALALPLVAFAWRSGARRRDLALAAVIGLVAAAGWATTSVLLMDDFDPLPVQSAAFTLPWTETLFWTIASTAIPATFGVGFAGGVLGGAFVSAAVRRELRLESFESPVQTLRYGAGAALMGVGGVLAGGCTIGAGLSGGATLSVAALIALSSIVLGGHLGRVLLAGRLGDARVALAV